MNKKFAARCGIVCEGCKFIRENNCGGCRETGGNPFWGECRLAKCSIEKELEHCGECSDFPCDMLREFAYDKEQGDDGKRIEMLEKWNEVGLEAWLASN